MISYLSSFWVLLVRGFVYTRQMNNHVSNNVLTKKHSSLSIRSSSSSSSSSGSSTFDGVAISCRRTTAAATGHHHVQTEVLEMKYFVPVQLWIAHPERTICYVCARHFSAFRRKHTCRMCGEVICKRCSVFKRVHVHVGENTVRVVRSFDRLESVSSSLTRFDRC